MTATVQIRRWEERDDIAQITLLLHRAYRELADMGFRYHATWQDDSTTLRRIRAGVTFLAERDEQIVGTATLYFPPAHNGCDWYDRADVARFGQFGVEPTLQRQGIGTMIIDAIEKCAIENGAENLALDTAEGAQHLIELYQAKGFELIGYADWDITNYRSVIMNKQLTSQSTRT